MDIALLQSWIGRSEAAQDLVTPRLVAEYVATFGARLAAVPAGHAPLGLHWCLAPAIAATDDLGEDGHPARGGLMPPVPLPRRMWAGGALETHDALRVGDTVTKRSDIADVAMKTGRTGPLCFVTVRYVYSTERGPALTERHDIVYREADAPAAAVPPPLPAPRAADLRWSVLASPALLFRFSAMTFNGHRIHYDLPYATDVEGYPGLIVHGLLQAALCLNAMAVLAGSAPTRFRFRSVSPLVAGTSFTVAARTLDGGIACWTQSTEGRIGMDGDSSSA